MNRKLNMEKISGYGVFFVLIGMLVLFSFIAPHFLEVNNFFNVSRQICTLGIVSVGMTIVMITGAEYAKQSGSIQIKPQSHWVSNTKYSQLNYVIYWDACLSC